MLELSARIILKETLTSDWALSSIQNNPVLPEWTQSSGKLSVDLHGTATRERESTLLVLAKQFIRHKTDVNRSKNHLSSMLQSPFTSVHNEPGFQTQMVVQPQLMHS